MGKIWLRGCLMNLVGFDCQDQIMAQVPAGCPIHAMLCDPFPMTSCSLPMSVRKMVFLIIFPSPYYVVMQVSTRDWGN